MELSPGESGDAQQCAYVFVRLKLSRIKGKNESVLFSSSKRPITWRFLFLVFWKRSLVP